MPVTNIESKEHFTGLINQGKLTLVDFYADWCGPCKAIGPYVEELSNTYGSKCMFIKVDIQENDIIANAYNVSGIPYFVFFREGRVVDSLNNAITSEIYGSDGENNPDGKNPTPNIDTSNFTNELYRPRSKKSSGIDDNKINLPFFIISVDKSSKIDCEFSSDEKNYKINFDTGFLEDVKRFY